MEIKMAFSREGACQQVKLRVKAKAWSKEQKAIASAVVVLRLELRTLGVLDPCDNHLHHTTDVQSAKNSLYLLVPSILLYGQTFRRQSFGVTMLLIGSKWWFEWLHLHSRMCSTCTRCVSQYSQPPNKHLKHSFDHDCQHPLGQQEVKLNSLCHIWEIVPASTASNCQRKDGGWL